MRVGNRSGLQCARPRRRNFVMRGDASLAVAGRSLAAGRRPERRTPAPRNKPTPSPSTSRSRTKGSGAGEQLCVAIFPGTDPDLTNPPLLSRCLDPGGAAVSFEGLRSGEYSVLLPGPGSELTSHATRVSSSPPPSRRTSGLASFGIDVAVGLAPEFAGTTGRVQVSVFGCPAGTDNGADKDSWAARMSGAGRRRAADPERHGKHQRRRVPGRHRAVRATNRAGSSSPTCRPAPTSSAASCRRTSLIATQRSSSNRASTAASAPSSRATPSPCARRKPSRSMSTWSSIRMLAETSDVVGITDPAITGGVDADSQPMDRSCSTDPLLEHAGKTTSAGHSARRSSFRLSTSTPDFRQPPICDIPRTVSRSPSARP